MAALSADYDSKDRSGRIQPFPVKAGVIIYQNAIVVNDGGYAAPGRTGLGLPVIGRAVEQVDNSAGVSGALMIQVERGCFTYDTAANGADQILASMAGQIAWLGDDHTIYATSGGGTRSPAGVIVTVDGDGVWCLMGFGPMPAQAGTLIAANNLADVVSPQAARQNLGANKVVMDGFINDLSSVGFVFNMVSPVAGTIKKFKSALQGALATGDATLQLAINGVAVTNGLIDQPQAGSAAGQVATAAPSALNVVAENDKITVTVGGTNTAHVAASFNFEIDT